MLGRGEQSAGLEAMKIWGGGAVKGGGVGLKGQRELAVAGTCFGDTHAQVREQSGIL